MKCPYNRSGSKQIYKIQRQYNDDNLETIMEYNFNEKYELMDCLKEECGAYSNGKCRYNQVLYEER